MKGKLGAAYRKFIMKENGAVSIYVIIVTLFIFIFNAVLIDFARIMVAEYQTEQAAKAAIRSSFSAFNKDVQNKGLFVINNGKESPEAIFQRVFKENLALDEDNYFKFVNTTMQSATFESNIERSFANVEIVKHQILEEMKYKAPIEFGKIILDGILPYSCAMQEANVLIEATDDVDKLLDNRDKEMKKAVEHLTTADNNLDQIKTKVKGPFSNSTYPDVNNLEDAVRHNDSYHEEPKNKYKNDLKQVLVDLKNKANDSWSEVREAKQNLLKAEKYNEKIVEVIQDAREDVEGKYDNLNASDCNEAVVNKVQEEIEGLTEQLKNYAMDPMFFEDAINKIDDARRTIYDESVPNTPSFVQFVSYQISDIDGMIEAQHISVSVNHINMHFDNAVADVDKARKYIDDNYEEKERGEESEDGGLTKAFQALKKIKEVIGKAKGFVDDFGKYKDLEKLVNDYGGALPANAGNLDMDDPKIGAKDSFNIISGLFNVIAKLAKDLRDEVYINEYILTRFKTDDKLGLFEPSSYPDTLLYKNREVEYILYGHHEPGVNYGHAILELAAIRFAFNFVSAFTQDVVKVAPHPIAKVLAALGWAFQETVDDIQRLTSGTPVDLLKIAKSRSLKTDYKFYLRLFLFLHSDPDDQRIHRIQAVVDDKTPADIIHAPTYATGTVEASVDLWFLPSVIKMVGATGVLSGKVKNGKYYIEKQIDYSY